MSIAGLALLSVFGGSVQSISLLASRGRDAFSCGAALLINSMAVLPFLLSNVLLLGATEIVLALLPYLLGRKNEETK